MDSAGYYKCGREEMNPGRSGSSLSDNLAVADAFMKEYG
jgi:hypothetical protein